MASLNNIAENIALSIGEQFNMTLRKSIKDSVVDWRAELIKQDLQRNPMSYTDYLQEIEVEFIEVDYNGRPILKSKQSIPKPIRQYYNGRINYNYVGNKNRDKTFTFATLQEFNYLSALPFQNNVLYYTVLGQDIYLLNSLKPCKLIVEEVIADPRLVEDCRFLDKAPDDLEFPVPVDMLSNIKKIIKGEYQTPAKDGAEINIDKDDRP